MFKYLKKITNHIPGVRSRQDVNKGRQLVLEGVSHGGLASRRAGDGLPPTQVLQSHAQQVLQHNITHCHMFLSIT